MKSDDMVLTEMLYMLVDELPIVTSADLNDYTYFITLAEPHIAFRIDETLVVYLSLMFRSGFIWWTLQTAQKLLIF